MTVLAARSWLKRENLRATAIAAATVVAGLGAEATVVAAESIQTSSQQQEYVLLAGIVGGKFGLTRLANHLERDGHRVTVIDPYELSLDSAEVSFAALARRVDRVLASHDVRKAHVVGHGHGGGVALRLAASYPERVSQLTLLDAGAVPVSKTKVFSSSVKLIPFLVRIPGGRRFVESRFAKGIRENLGRTDWFDKPTQRIYTGMVLDTPGAIGLAGRLASAEEPEPVAAVVARVRVPVLVILGGVKHSAAPGKHDLDLLTPLGSALRVEVLDSVGHFPHEEATDEVVRLLYGTALGRIQVVDSIFLKGGEQPWLLHIANPTPANFPGSFLPSRSR